ncbi:MAG: hypothetical protein QXX32_07095 [Thermofilum sp.]
MRMLVALLLAVVLCVGALAAITIMNVNEWHVQATQPPVKKIAGRDRTSCCKNANIYTAVEDGLNVTYVVVSVPSSRFYTVFVPVLNVSGSGVSAKLFAESVSGSYAGQLNASITLGANLQVVVSRGTITQQTGTPVTISGQTSFKLSVKIGSSVPVGAEVGRIYTWLYFNYSTAKARQKIVWIVKRLPGQSLHIWDYDSANRIVVRRNVNQNLGSGQSFKVSWFACVSNVTDPSNVGVVLQEVEVLYGSTYDWYSFYYFPSNPAQVWAGGVPVNVDPRQWHNYTIILTRSGNTLTAYFYIDGVLRNTVSSTRISVTVLGVQAGRYDVRNMYDLYIDNVAMRNVNGNIITEDFEDGVDNFFVDTYTSGGNTGKEVG